MGIVAVAGGTGGIGRTLVGAIVARGHHTVKILSRKPTDTLAAELGVSIVPVNYEDVAKVTGVFEENNIDTVISAIATNPTEDTSPEIFLIRAAEAAKPTRRFVASNWGAPIDNELIRRLPSSVVKEKNAAELEKTSLEYTSFYIGFILDYFADPTHKSHMQQATFFIDTAHKMAAIPGAGDTAVTLTHTLDLATFVARMLDLSQWETGYYVAGDTVTFNQLVQLVEEARGTKFHIVHDSVEDLENGKATELPAVAEMAPFLPFPKEVLIRFSALFGLLFEKGVFDFSQKKLLNQEFPDVETLKVKEAVQPAAA